jgi:hypothetical protein
MMHWLLLVLRDSYKKEPSSSSFQHSIIASLRVLNDYEGPVHGRLHYGYLKGTSLYSLEIHRAFVHEI